MIIVFDSNIWLSHLGMRSPAASAIRFFLKQNNYLLALPEVIRLEVEANLHTKLMNFIDEIKNAHEQLLTVFGQLHEVVLPTQNNVEDLISDLFSSLGVELINIPFSLESARSSLLKTIYKIQPSNNNQQFKDGVLWADCIALLNTDDVTLVTADQAFYSGHRYENGLAKNLQQEANQCLHKISLVNNLEKLMQSMPRSFDFNDEDLIQLLLQKAETNVASLVAKNGFRVGATVEIERSLFATEDPCVLFFTFAVSIACDDILELQAAGTLRLKADGFYKPEDYSFNQVGMLEATFKFQGLDGEMQERKGAYLRAEGMTIGHRTVVSRIRQKIE